MRPWRKGHGAGRLPGPPRRGAAMLLALLVLTVVSTLASAMVWQQWRSVQAEEAERTRAQSAWILDGALDWARLILREDARTGGADHLGEPWAVPLAEARLSSFLAGENATPTDSAELLDAFLSGSIVDAQSRYNLRNLVDGNRLLPAQMAILQRLCLAADIPADVATQLAESLRAAWAAAPGVPASPGSAPQGAYPPTDESLAQAPLAPDRMSQLRWLGISAQALDSLEKVAVILPARTPLNINTASAEVLSAVIEGLGPAGAQRIVQVRAQRPFTTLEQASAFLPPPSEKSGANPAQQLSVTSNFFEIEGSMRIAERSLRERSLVMRKQLDVLLLQRERSSRLEPVIGKPLQAERSPCPSC